jgi:hypothetical protein
MTRWSALFIVHLAWAALQGQCSLQRPPEPGEAALAAPLSIDDLRLLDEPVVRLYAAPVSPVTDYAVHPWFIVKKAGSRVIDRWEVWQLGDAPYGYVRKNLLRPEDDVGAGRVFVVAELRGPRAEQVAAFIESNSPRYPCRDSYSFLGPNSNTYAQWVINETGWRVTMPQGAVGTWAVGVCSEQSAPSQQASARP